MPSRGQLRPVGPSGLRLTGGLWREYQQLNRSTIIGHCAEWMERIGWIGNFDWAAGGAGAHRGIEFVDSEVYKLLEALAWELGREHDDELAALYDDLVIRIAAAQDPDGYLHTSFGRPGQPARYSNLEWGHELYCFGHLLQAATARLRSGEDDLLPRVARRVADHLWLTFGPDGRVAVCGHPEIELGLAEFGRATGDRRYLELAKLFVDRRGTGTLGPIEYGPEYFQDDIPVRDATVLRGHAVRALYLASGALDVADEFDDAELARAVEVQYRNALARRTYVTGGVGSHHQDEAFGADFELPNDRAYAETCAAIASHMTSWRLLLATGDETFADVSERTLLNAVLVGPRADGRAFYYSNTLHQRTRTVAPPEDETSPRASASQRAPWFDVSCCPTNLARTLASIETSFATTSAEGVQLHQYGDYDLDVTLQDGRRVALRVTGDYPRAGRVRIEVTADEPRPVALQLRIPLWAAGVARVADGERAIEVDGPTVTISRPLRAGDTIVLDLPMQPTFVAGDPRIDAVRGQRAVTRGPWVLALEDVDLPGGVDVEEVAMNTSVPPEPEGDGARVQLTRVRPAPAPGPFAYLDGAPAEVEGPGMAVTLHPYMNWANRGPSTMRVWIPTV